MILLWISSETQSAQYDERSHEQVAFQTLNEFWKYGATNESFSSCQTPSYIQGHPAICSVEYLFIWLRQLASKMNRSREQIRNFQN